MEIATYLFFLIVTCIQVKMIFLCSVHQLLTGWRQIDWLGTCSWL